MDYLHMAPKSLKVLYEQRAQELGVTKPLIPRTKERLISVLRATDMLGKSKANPDDPIRQMVTEMFKEGTKEKQTRFSKY